MKVTLSNVCNVKSGVIEIKPNKLNLKFGNNGIGKTSIITAITNEINGEEMTELVPYGTTSIPFVAFSDGTTPTTVSVFNEDYVEEHLFKEDLVRDTHEIMVISNDYNEKLDNIENTISKVFNYATSNAFLTSFVTDILEFDTNVGFKGDHGEKGLNFVKKAGKGVKNGNPYARVEDTNGYKPLITSEKGSKWRKWYDEGKQYFNEQNKCPYCLNETIDPTVVAWQERLNEVCSSKEVADLETSLTLFDKILKYCSQADKDYFRPLLTSPDVFPVEASIRLKVILDTFKTEVYKLNEIKAKDYKKLQEEVESGDIISTLTSLKLDESVFVNMDPDLDALKNVKALNKEIDDVLANATTFRDQLVEINNAMAKNIEKNRKFVNEFLLIAGMPYVIDVIDEDNVFTTVLKPANVDEMVGRPASRLSYGEKNALSLLLFTLDACSTNPDLIILDDPISSFDTNKKYALLHKLFSYNTDEHGNHLHDNLLKRTVLMVTHDFSLVIDIVKTDIMNIKKYKNSYVTYVKNTSGNLIENEVLESNIISRIDYEEQKAMNQSSSKVCRIVHFRRLLEFEGLKGCPSYSLASAFLHAQPTPRDMDGNVIQNWTNIQTTIRSTYPFMNDFDYVSWLNELTLDKVVQDYKSATSSEKLEIARFYVNKNGGYDSKGNRVLGTIIWNYLTEGYHIENEIACALDDSVAEFDTVPKHLVAACDEIMGI